MYNIFMYLYSI